MKHIKNSMHVSRLSILHTLLTEDKVSCTESEVEFHTYLRLNSKPISVYPLVSCWRLCHQLSNKSQKDYI